MFIGIRASGGGLLVMKLKLALAFNAEERVRDFSINTPIVDYSHFEHNEILKQKVFKITLFKTMVWTKTIIQK